MKARTYRIIRFIISGGVATVLLIGTLYVFTSLFHIWYVTSAIIAFLLATAISFTLQKYWAFRNHERNFLKRQILQYLVIQGWDLILNTGGLYLLVSGAHLWYLFAQFIISLIIAIQNYLLYRAFVFPE